MSSKKKFPFFGKDEEDDEEERQLMLELQAEYDELLHAFARPWQPAPSIEEADHLPTTAEIQLSIVDHMGSGPKLRYINSFLAEMGFTKQPNADMQIVWLMRRR